MVRSYDDISEVDSFGSKIYFKPDFHGIVAVEFIGETENRKKIPGVTAKFRVVHTCPDSPATANPVGEVVAWGVTRESEYFARSVHELVCAAYGVEPDQFFGKKNAVEPKKGAFAEAVVGPENLCAGNLIEVVSERRVRSTSKTKGAAELTASDIYYVTKFRRSMNEADAVRLMVNQGVDEVEATRRLVAAGAIEVQK